MHSLHFCLRRCWFEEQMLLFIKYFAIHFLKEQQTSATWQSCPGADAQRSACCPVLSTSPLQALLSPKGCGWTQLQKEMSKTRLGPALKKLREGRAVFLPE